ncbi:MAG: D-alanine--D-alanine ligase [Endomicrobium sp.]|jgi:D-alanine-D-alanine ligase|nr:D-alanine--D-alanine ligase [Endomicrobium sp.]
MMTAEKLKNKKIGVLYGGTSSEREISLKSGKAVINALKKMKFKVAAIDVDKNAAEKIKKEKIDIAYVALHGQHGEDGTIQGMLEVMGIPYTGCGVFASSASMDKNISKLLFNCAGILTPDWFVLRKYERINEIKTYPVVVKPANQGSAIGISIVKKASEFAAAAKTAFKYGNEVIVEQFIKGKEITVGVLDGKSLPAVEIMPKGKFYDYKSKYAKGGSKHIIPARISKEMHNLAARAAEKVYKLFKCKAVCRVDMIIDRDEKIWVLENNTIPGMTETSLLPDEAKVSGIKFEELILKIIECSL